MGNVLFVLTENVTEPLCPGATEASAGVFAVDHAMVFDCELNEPSVWSKEKLNIGPMRFAEMFTFEKLMFELLVYVNT